MHKHFSTDIQRAEIIPACKTASIGCIQCKEILAKNIIEELIPIQENYAELNKNINTVKERLHVCAQKAKLLAQGTIKEVKEKMGLKLV